MRKLLFFAEPASFHVNHSLPWLSVISTLMLPHSLRQHFLSKQRFTDSRRIAASRPKRLIECASSRIVFCSCWQRRKIVDPRPAAESQNPEIIEGGGEHNDTIRFVEQTLRNIVRNVQDFFANCRGVLDSILHFVVSGSCQLRQLDQHKFYEDKTKSGA